MNRLKPIFISAYLSFSCLLSGYAIWSMWRDGDLLAWAGVLLVCAPLLILLLWMMLTQRSARTSPGLTAIHLAVLVGLLLSTIACYRGAPSTAPLLGAAGTLGFWAYIYWYSRFNRHAQAALAVGALLPELAFTDEGGQTIASGDFLGQPTVWLFYRGNWCPLCMAQIKELAARYQELQALGVRVALVSPQPHQHTAKLAQRFEVAMDFLTDPENCAARALGIDVRHGIPMGLQVLGYDSETVMPTVIITDAQNQIVWTHEADNYRVRPEPETFFAVLRERGLV